MNPRDREDFAERWVDEMLVRYSDAEPRDGMEGRILANLAAKRNELTARRRWLVWVPVAGAAVAAVLVSVLALRPATEGPSAVAPVVRAGSPAKDVVSHVSSANVGHPAHAAKDVLPNVTSANVERPANVVHPARQLVAERTEPRKPQFLAPMPSAEQERLLAAYVNATPTQELLAVAAEQREWRERVQRNADTTAQEAAPSREINHLQIPPPESGSTEASAYGAR